MTANQPLNILKEAILLERRGKAFYSKVAEQTADPAVKEFFEIMAQEEDRHIEILEKQFAAYVQNQQFAPLSADEKDQKPQAYQVLSGEIKDKIAAAEFEAAAISAAMLMEERAVAFYGGRAKEADSPDEEMFYLWLSDFEQGAPFLPGPAGPGTAGRGMERQPVLALLGQTDGTPHGPSRISLS
jgi:rubrerythrin